jgi:AraC-like DNA-binding protein
MQHIIKGWSFQNLLLEYYRYAPGPAEWLPPECHREYQFCLSLNCPGQYQYRSAHHWVPTGSLSIIHPGEVHSARDIDDRQADATFRMLYLDPSRMQQIVESMSEHPSVLPFFPAIVLDADLAQRFLAFHIASTRQAARLEQDALLLDVISTSIQRYAAQPLTLRPIQPERQAVRRVRDYLYDHVSENVSLDQLAQVANLSPHYLSRVFHAEVGISLQRYQMQVRIEQAKRLLTQGKAIWQVASETGFVDQSHLTHQFRRIVKTTPGKYRLRK